MALASLRTGAWLTSRVESLQIRMDGQENGKVAFAWISIAAAMGLSAFGGAVFVLAYWMFTKDARLPCACSNRPLVRYRIWRISLLLLADPTMRQP
jgi:hypothetical protein